MSYKGAHLLSDLNTIEEDSELHTWSRMRNRDLDSFAKPEQVHDSPSLPDLETTDQAIADRLKDIPGFETYSYHDSDTSEGSHDNVARNLPEAASADGSRERSVLRNFTIPRGSEIFQARDELKTLSRVRSDIVSLQVSFDTSTRRIDRARRDFLTEINQLGKLLNCIEGTELVRESLNMQISSLNECNAELKREEDASAELSQRLIQKHWNLKAAEDRLYAKLSGGTKPEDSEAAEEDQQFEKRLLALGTRFPTASGSSSSIHRTRSLDRAFADTAIQTIPQTHSFLSPANQPPHSLDPTAKFRSGDDISHMKSSAKPRILKDHLFAERAHLKSVGCWLNDSKVLIPDPTMISAELNILELQEEESSVSETLVSLTVLRPSAAPSFLTFQAARRKDFQLLLGYDIQWLDPGMSRIKKLDQLAGPRNFRGLVDIEVPTFHTSQHIAMWGRDMAQNALLETSRLLLYSKTKFRSFVKLANPDSFIKPSPDVCDLGKFSVKTKGSRKHSMAARSISVQPSEHPDDFHSLDSLKVYPVSNSDVSYPVPGELGNLS